MNWKEVERQPFTYNGERVLRRKVLCQTIFGDFEVFEAVNGKPYVVHPYLKNDYINPVFPYNNGLEDWFGKTKTPCKDIEDGVKMCENIMDKIKKIVNAY